MDAEGKNLHDLGAEMAINLYGLDDSALSEFASGSSTTITTMKSFVGKECSRLHAGVETYERTDLVYL
jgi:hypothetical protein